MNRGGDEHTRRCDMFACVFNRATALAGIVAASCVAVAPALATDLPPGSTLEPIPVVALPADAVLEGTYTRDFDITWTPAFPNPPIPRHVTGTITQNLYRRADNSLIFRYRVTNDAASQGAVTRISISNFSGFETDVSLLSSTFCLNCENADRAVRDDFGTGISFEYD